MKADSNIFRPSLLRRLPLTTFLTGLVALLLGAATLGLLSIHQQQVQHIQADHTQHLGGALSQQLAISSVPLVLSHDWVSLNISLKHLISNPQIAGVEIVDRKGETLAQAGSISSQLFEHAIVTGDTPLGHARLYLEPLALSADIRQQSNTLYIAAALVLAVLLGLCYWFARKLSEALGSLNETWTYNAASDSAKPTTTETSSPLADSTTTPETPLTEHDFASVQKPESVNIAAATAQFDISGPAEASFSVTLDEPGFDSLGTSNLETSDSETSNQEASHLDVSNLSTSDLDTSDTDTSGSDASNNTPSYEPDDPNLAINEEDSVSPYAATDSPAPSANPNNFLLYVSQHSSNNYDDSFGDSDEDYAQDALLDFYRPLFELAIKLYSGQPEFNTHDQWSALFAETTQDASNSQVPAGVNALCAAQLFKGLYQGFNRLRIQQMQPVLNLKTVLLAGESQEALADEAEDLVISLHTNELISSQAIFDNSELKQRLLNDGEFKYLGEGRYQISRLNPDFQDLIDRQTEHFLMQQGYTNNLEG